MADIKYQIDVDTSKGINNLKNLQNQVNRTSEGFGNFKKVILAAAAAVGAGVFVSSIKGAMDSVDGLAKSARALGVSVGNFQALARSAENAGIGLGELQATAQRLQNTLVNSVAKGSGPATEGLQRLGLSARDLVNQPVDQQLEKITEALRGIENPAERTALAIELLGKQGPRMLEVADSAARLRQELESLGLGLTNVDTAVIEAANDAVSELRMLWESVRQKIAAEVAPYLIAVTRYIKESVMNMGDLGTKIRTGVIPAVRELINVMIVLTAIFGFTVIIAAVLKIIAMFTALTKLILATTAAMKAFNVVVAASGLLKLAGVVAALATALLGAKLAIDVVQDGFKDLDKEVEKILSELKKQQEVLSGSQETVTEINSGLNEQEKLTQNITANIKRAAQGYQEVANQQAKSIRQKIEDIGLDEDQLRLKETIRQAESAYLAESKRLQDELYRLKQSNDEKDQAQIQVVLKLLGELDKKYKNNLETNEKLTHDLNSRLRLHREELQIFKDIEESIKRREQAESAVRNIMIDGIENVRRARESAELDSLVGVQRTLRQIEIEERRVAEAAKRRVAEQFGDNDPQGLIKAFEEIDRAAQFVIERRKEAIEAIVREQRTFAYGWQKAFAEYRDNATNAAKAAESLFKKATQGMEDAIVNFAKTGKFEFKNFVNTVLEELLRVQIRRTFANIFGGGGGSGGGGSLFSGFFATGGMIPPGRFGVVGERGPELVQGPADVTPLTGTSVTYNINAVDASSFKEMLSRDPSFLYAVSEQGRRRAPGTRR